MFRTSHFRLISNHLSGSNTAKHEPVVLFDYNNHACKVTLNRPKELNALYNEAYDLLTNEVRKWNNNPNIKIVIFEGKGPAFSSGVDIKALYINYKDAEHGIPMDFSLKTSTTDILIANMKPIQVALWNGIVMGGGAGISAFAPVKIATEKCVFAMPESKIGFFTNVGGGHFLAKVRNNIGLYLGLTGNSLKGKEVVQTGFADFFVRSEKLDALKQEIFETTSSSTKIENVRNIVRKYAEPVEEKYVNEDFIKENFSKNSLEEIYRGLKEKAKNDEFAAKIVAAMDSYSPLSLIVVFEQITLGKELSLLENTLVETRLVKRFGTAKDFFEGVRCMLVDRKDKPNYKYKQLKDVPREEVNRYFSPLPNEKELMDQIIKAL